MTYLKEKQQKESIYLIQINYIITLGASPSPSPTRQRTGQAPRGREPQKNKASGKEARQIKVNRYSKEKQQKLGCRVNHVEHIRRS